MNKPPHEIEFPKSNDELYKQCIQYVTYYIDWYRWKKKPKQLAAWWLRLLSTVAVAGGALFPILSPAIVASPNIRDWGYVLLWLGGALFLIDKSLDLSGSWCRFMKCYLELEGHRERFKVSWSLLACQSTAVSRECADLADGFILAVNREIATETLAWADQFLAANPAASPSPSGSEG